MGGFRKPTFDEEIRNLKEDSEEYKAIVRRHDAIQKARNEQDFYKQRLIRRILDLCEPFRGINRSKLGSLGNTRLTQIGKAAKALNDAMKEAGLITFDRVSDKFDDFL